MPSYVLKALFWQTVSDFHSWHWIDGLEKCKPGNKVTGSSKDSS